jgi:hypothetical protein
MAQDVDFEDALHELRQRAFQHDQEGDAEEAEGHGPANLKTVRQQDENFCQGKDRQNDQKELIVLTITVALAMPDQGGEQQADNAEQKQLAAKPE